MDIDLGLVVQIFVLLDPFASFPFLISTYRRKMDVRIIALKAVLVAFLIAITITFIGPSLFSIFGITLDSFRIAGGIVLLLLGIHMVNPTEEDTEFKEIHGLITIIATPLLTGPGTISFITVKAYEIGQMAVAWNLCIAFILVGLVFFLFSLLVTRINVTVVDIVSRVMGLFLSAVAIEMIAKGIEGIIRSVM